MKCFQWNIFKMCSVFSWEIKNEIVVFQKYGKFWSIYYGTFYQKYKLFISEEWKVTAEAFLYTLYFFSLFTPLENSMHFNSFAGNLRTHLLSRKKKLSLDLFFLLLPIKIFSVNFNFTENNVIIALMRFQLFLP